MPPASPVSVCYIKCTCSVCTTCSMYVQCVLHAACMFNIPCRQYLHMLVTKSSQCVPTHSTCSHTCQTSACSIQMMVASSPTPLADTSRPMRFGEINGKDYYFATREQMEKEIRNKHFLEYGEHKGNLYGISIETVMNLMKLGRVPVLDLHPQVCMVCLSASPSQSHCTTE